MIVPTLLLLSVVAFSELGTQPPNPQQARVPGIIDFGTDGKKDVLSAPTRVRVGEDFEIKVTTYGGGCDREGDTSVIILATGAAVMVYDLTVATHPRVICPAVVKRMPHTVTLRFEKPGEALIQIWGRRVGPEAPLFGVPAVLEHRVTIK
jgi:hypothetical protein